VVVTGDVPSKRKRLVLHAFRRSRHALAGRCRLVHAAWQSFEQPQSELLLGRIQPPKEGRVVDPKRPRCASEAPRPCHDEHEAQVIPIIHGKFDANPSTCRIANMDRENPN